MKHLLDNIFWHALTGTQAKFATGDGDARRYARGFSPILGFADAQRPDFDAIAPWCAPDERFHCDGWAGPVAAGWLIETESTMFKMVFEGDLPAPPDEAPELVRLGGEHATQALELAILTRPGPFGLRTIELGDYFGCFEGERLVAMAGERSLGATAGVRLLEPLLQRAVERRSPADDILDAFASVGGNPRAFVEKIRYR